MARAKAYNLGIPNIILNSVEVAPRKQGTFPVMALLALTLAGSVPYARAADWNTAEQQLARKILSITGSGNVSLTFENRSSLGRRDSEIVQNGIRDALGASGIRAARPEQPFPVAVKISLSENLSSYVWVAEVRRSDADPSVVMVAMPRPETAAIQDSVPLSIRKTLLWTEADPILDILVLEEGSTPTRIAVLSPERISIYRMQAGRWQIEQSAQIKHAQPWPLDLRGRLVMAKDHLLDAYLAGVVCNGTEAAQLALNCRDSDDPWPLTVATLSGGESPIPAIRAFFAPARNFFTGALTPGIGKLTSVPKFYSAAPLPRQKSLLWLFAATDGFVHIIDGTSDQPLRLLWGSDVASVKTACGAGWQVLATGAEQNAGDSVRAFELPDRDPVPVSAAVDFSGGISALWTEARGDTAVAVTKNLLTGSYEAFRLSVACNQ